MRLLQATVCSALRMMCRYEEIVGDAKKEGSGFVKGWGGLG